MNYTIEEIKQINRRFRRLRKRNRVVKRRPKCRKQKQFQDAEKYQHSRNDESHTVLIRCGDGCLMIPLDNIRNLFKEPFKQVEK